MNIESILQAARDIELENIQVSQIYKFSSRLSRFHFLSSDAVRTDLLHCACEIVDELIQKKNTRTSLAIIFLRKRERYLTTNCAVAGN
jgi:hypothetical protein